MLAINWPFWHKLGICFERKLYLARAKHHLAKKQRKEPSAFLNTLLFSLISDLTPPLCQAFSWRLAITSGLQLLIQRWIQFLFPISEQLISMPLKQAGIHISFPYGASKWKGEGEQNLHSHLLGCQKAARKWFHSHRQSHNTATLPAHVISLRKTTKHSSTALGLLLG